MAFRKIETESPAMGAALWQAPADDAQMEKHAVAVKPDAPSFLSVIDRAVQTPGFNVENLDKLIAAQERIMAKNAEIAFNQAMSDLQPKLPQIKKTTKGHNNKYAPYEEIDEVVRPLYTAHGFSVTFNSKKENGHCTYYGTLSHREGHSRTAEIQLPDDNSGGKNAIQAVASTVSYARRYLLCMLLNIVTTEDDDDGAATTKRITEAQAKELKDLIKETGSDTKAMLALSGAKSIDDLPASAYEGTKALLLKKKGRKNG